MQTSFLICKGANVSGYLQHGELTEVVVQLKGGLPVLDVGYIPTNELRADRSSTHAMAPATTVVDNASRRTRGSLVV
jgi:hypothetical protein